MDSSSPACWRQLGSLEIRVFGDVDRRDVVLRGDLDLCTADQLRGALDDCAAMGSRLVVIDLSALGFLAVAGLEVLFHAHEMLQASGGTLVLVGPGRSARRILRLTELDTVLNVEVGRRADNSAAMRTWMSQS